MSKSKIPATCLNCQAIYNRHRGHKGSLQRFCGKPCYTEYILSHPEDRFWKYVNKDGPIPEYRPELGPCWLWTGWKVKGGYGFFVLGNRKKIAATHFIYKLETGHEIPEGMQPDHLCRTTSCVRFSHLEIVTPRINILRSESPPAVNAKKLHCANGHEFTPENTYHSPGPRGQRVCKTCRNQWQKSFNQRHG